MLPGAPCLSINNHQKNTLAALVIEYQNYDPPQYRRGHPCDGFAEQRVVPLLGEEKCVDRSTQHLTSQVHVENEMAKHLQENTVRSKVAVKVFACQNSAPQSYNHLKMVGIRYIYTWHQYHDSLPPLRNSSLKQVSCSGNNLATLSSLRPSTPTPCMVASLCLTKNCIRSSLGLFSDN
jgi:hypothetical protein